MSEVKTPRPSYSDEQKAEVKAMLIKGKTHKEINTATGVGLGTITKIAKDSKNIKPQKELLEDLSEAEAVNALNVLIKKAKVRLEEVEVLIAADSLAKERDRLKARIDQLEGILKTF